MSARILIIDDEPGIREGCRRVLEPEGHLVETAETLHEGLVKAQAGEFDLVLLDVMLPDGRGITLLKPLAEHDPDLVTVIITGYATVELAVEAIRQGAYDFISKPFTVDALLMTVHQGLERRRLTREAQRAVELEKERAALEQARLEAEKLGAFKAQYVYLIAHELRSPVTSAQSLLRTLIKGFAGELNDRQQDILQRLDMRLGTLLELINDLLVLASSKTLVKAGELTKVPIAPVARWVVEQSQVEAGTAGVTLSYQGFGDIGEILGTEDGLKKVLCNLVTNAVKYTPHGGRVELVVKKEAGEISLAVSDTGIGISEAALEHLGEEFFRAPNAREKGIPGTGLGLSIVKQYVEQMGGRLEIQSKVGEGSVFTVRFPAAN